MLRDTGYIETLVALLGEAAASGLQDSLVGSKEGTSSLFSSSPSFLSFFFNCLLVAQVALPMLRALGNIVSVPDDAYTEMVLALGALSSLACFLQVRKGKGGNKVSKTATDGS